jgi:hypothetical protein
MTESAAASSQTTVSQTITFTTAAPSNATVGSGTYTPAATATSGLPVTFTLSGASKGCLLASGVVSFAAAGTCVIDANQAGNATYRAAPQVKQSFKIATVSQTITFTSAAPSKATVGGGTYTPAATATSGLPVTFTLSGASKGCLLASGVVSFAAAGTCVIDANQAGNATYTAAPQVKQSFKIVKALQTITLNVDNSSPAGGVAANFIATATGFTTGDTIDIFDSQGSFSHSCTTNPCTASDTESGSVTYTADLYDSTSDLVASSAPVTVTWPVSLCTQPITTDTTLSAGAPYIVNCTLDVPSGDTLTIDPGVVMKFGSGDGFTVEGTLDAVGTSALSITLTSVNDNSVGGSTGSGSPAAGDWDGIFLNTGTLDLQDAALDYAGNGNYGYGVISAVASDPSNPGSGSITASHDTFLVDVAAINVDTTGAVIVTANTFTGNSYTPVTIDAPTPTVANNSVSQSAGQGSPAFSVTGTALDADLLSDNAVSGGGALGFAVGGTMGTTSTLDAESDPWEVTYLDVPADVTLTVAPGVVVKGKGGGNCPTGSPCSLEVEGTLDAVGTTTSRITFTSVNDNSVGGSTGNGSPVRDDWDGIFLDTGSLDVEDAALDYGYYPDSPYSREVSTIASDLSNPGTGAITVSNDTFFDDPDAVDLDTHGAVTFTDNTIFTNNSSTPVTIDAPTPTVENNSVSQSVGQGSPAFAVTGTALDANLLRDNTVSGGGALGFNVAGTIGTSSTLDAEADPWEVTYLTVPAGVTLTVAPGAVVKGSGNGSTCLCSLEVEGTFDAVGTAALPITFTSVNDNSVGGLTGLGTPTPGDWGGILVIDAGTVDIENAAVEYGVYSDYHDLVFAAIVSDPNNPGSGSITVSNDTFLADQAAVNVDTTGTVVITNDTFTNAAYTPVTIDAPTPTVRDNSVSQSDGQGSPAFSIAGTAIDADLFRANTVSGGGALGFDVGGTIGTSSTLDAESDPWEVTALNVATGVTLTVAPGAVVKGVPHGAGGCPTTVISDGSDSCGLSVQGILDADGTAGLPITFTSVNDNSVGGSTGSGTPTDGDWDGILLVDSGALDLEDATVEYANPYHTSCVVNCSELNFGAVSATASDLGNPGSGSITAVNDNFFEDGDAIAVNTTGAVVVSDDTFTDNASTPVTIDAPTPTVEKNTVTQSAGQGSPAFSVTGTALDLDLFRDNTVSGDGVLGFEVGGADRDPAASVTANGNVQPGIMGTSSTLDAEADPWEVTYQSLDVPAGITLTIAPGAVVKGEGACSYCDTYAISVEGMLVAVGATVSPIVFTSVNDNSVAGSTGSGTPLPGDWDGIDVDASGSIDVENSTIEYAGTGVQVLTNENALIADNVFTSNGTAVAVFATIGTNAIVQENVFDQNTIALTGISGWFPLTVANLPLCQYIPTIQAGGNTFGDSSSSTPFFSPSDWASVQSLLLVPGTEQYPDKWAAAVLGNPPSPTDQINYTVQDCYSDDDGELEADIYVASPFDLNAALVTSLLDPPSMSAATRS